MDIVESCCSKNKAVSATEQTVEWFLEPTTELVVGPLPVDVETGVEGWGGI